MAKINCGIAVLFCCCVFISIINQVAYADKEATSEEVIEEEYRHTSAESVNGTSEELSLESHEAMTRGGEFKPKFTTAATASTATSRQKRSYEFLLGLVNNNSKFQVTNAEDDIRIPRRNKIYSGDLGASELLLEMMVKIAAHPDQWEQVHNLLQKIDDDLKTSKKIISEMDKALTQQENQKKKGGTNENIEINKKLEKSDSIKYSTEKEHSNATRRNKTKADNSQLLQTLYNEKETNPNIKNVTNDALKTNQWSYGIVNEKVPKLSMDNNEDALTTRYPWNVQTKPAKSTYPRNFAYHRVTGNPLYHNNLNSNPKAYIAVSVIAPKPINERPIDDDMVLENELRELKPWTHNQNLKNMASIRSRWVIQSDKDKAAYTQ